MRYIPLTQGKRAIVDNDDFERIAQYKWYAHKERNLYYARRNGPMKNRFRSVITMHSIVISVQPGMEMVLIIERKIYGSSQPDRINKISTPKNQANIQE